MRFPIKFKTERVPGLFRRMLPNKPDPTALLRGEITGPLFSRCVSSICVGGTWKTTNPARHATSTEFLLQYLPTQNDLRVLDAGISDGITTLELVQALEGRYVRVYATDLCLRLFMAEADGMCYVRRQSRGPCIMAVSPRLLFYESATNRGLLARISSRVRAAMPAAAAEREVELVHPDLLSRTQRDARIRLMEWNVFGRWPAESVNVVRAANLLNRAYFAPEQLQAALVNLRQALVVGGRMLVVDSRKSAENAIILEKTEAGWTSIARMGARCDVEAALGN